MTGVAMYSDLTLLERAKQMRAEGLDTEEILTFFRKSGCSKIGSMRLMMSLEGLILDAAKHRVHFSRTWEDVRDADETFQETVVEAAERLPRREPVR
jgi:hypothetical protein